MEIAIHKLDHKYNWQEVAEILLKDTEESSWVSTLHDIDPEKMEQLIRKMQREKEMREADTRRRQPGVAALTSRPGSPASPGSSSARSQGLEQK